MGYQSTLVMITEAYQDAVLLDLALVHMLN